MTEQVKPNGGGQGKEEEQPKNMPGNQGGPESTNTGDFKGLIAEACRAYGIDKKFVLSSRMDGDAAIIVTQGGAKVQYRKGDEVEKLSPIRVTGVNPENERRKPVAGKGSRHAKK